MIKKKKMFVYQFIYLLCLSVYISVHINFTLLRAEVLLKLFFFIIQKGLDLKIEGDGQ